MKRLINLFFILIISSSSFLMAQSLFLSSKASEDIVSKEALRNPDRGLHLECNFVITAGTPETMFNPYGSGVGQILEVDEDFEYYPDGFIRTRTEELKTEEDSITLTQLYMYLQEFREVDVIPESAINNIKTLFQTLRDSGYKAILRFAYRNEHTLPKNLYPTAERTLKHAQQLAPVITENIDVISVIQSGFIGQWGEWTPSFSTSENNAIMKALLAGIPEGYGMEMRYCSRKNGLKPEISADDYNRIGFNNDYFTGGQHPMACGGSDFGCPKDDQYKQVAKESFDAYVSGEVPHEGKTDPTWGLDFMLDTDGLFPILKLHHYVAMDITQNFYNNIKYWRTVKVYPAKLERLGIFFDQDYFKEDGKFVIRSFYQFVRDHLGYRLNVKEATFNKDGEKLQYDIRVTNTGFATVHNPKSVFLVLIDSNNQIAKEIKLDDVNPKAWQPWAVDKPDELLVHTISGSVNPQVAAGTYKVGLTVLDNEVSIKDLPEYQIKFSTDNGKATHWTNKDKTRVVNIIGTATL
ncbi:DUF4832 domain-containing protein [Paludibacter sp. 221]|uniref:DUF4832 domain-containing protein n=1 Tax=Paludibacter sp. 221 TaxID=2302939 RepID=UPI0013D47933|nr:DUF4874 domain-containing protein [Paludibacter sp. 221]NDV46729.1 DUF4832 domain-containing protein [Paludibacter sp. 221]